MAFFTDPMLNPGNRIITVRKIQELRGLRNHWSYANKFWHYVASPVNGLIAFADMAGAWIRCGNDQVWIAFWNLIAFIRAMGDGDNDWGSIFYGIMGEIASVPKRVGGKRGNEKSYGQLEMLCWKGLVRSIGKRRSIS